MPWSLRSLLLLLAVASVSWRNEPSPLKLVQTIPLDGVKGRIDHMAADVDGRRLYVAALGNDTMEVIDLAAGKRVGSVAGLKKPTGIRVLPGSRNVVVASADDGKVRLFTPDLKLIAAVDGLDDADNVRLDPAGEFVYVGYGDGAVAVIDAQRFTKVADVQLGGHPESFQLEASGNRIFANVPTRKNVTVIDRQTRTVIATWPLGEAEANFPMALDEQANRLFVGCRKPPKVIVIDTRTGKAMTSIDCCGDADDLFFDAQGKTLYVSGGAGRIDAIKQERPDEYRLLGSVSTSNGARTSLYVPEMSLLFVAIPARAGQQAEVRAYRVGAAQK